MRYLREREKAEGGAHVGAHHGKVDRHQNAYGVGEGRCARATQHTAQKQEGLITPWTAMSHPFGSLI